jgi:hypothetical protein
LNLKEIAAIENIGTPNTCLDNAKRLVDYFMLLQEDLDLYFIKNIENGKVYQMPHST